MNIIPWRHKRETNGQESRGLWPVRSELETLFERLVRDPFAGLSLAARDWGFGRGPTMDISEDEQHVTMRFELPGVTPEDIELNVSGNVLTLSGEKSEQREEKKEDCTYSERSFGRFSRSVQLPSTVNPDKVDAQFKHGVLTVKLEKRPEARPKRITVRA